MSKEAIWIIDNDGKPNKFNDETGRFEVKGEIRRGKNIYAGLNGLALMISKSAHAYEIDLYESWIPVG